MQSKILITGAIGFIGFHLSKKLLKSGENIIGIDNINSYYDVKLKKDRLKALNEESLKFKGTWIFIEADINDIQLLKKIFQTETPKLVINLAAQAGVRYSLENPRAYINSNITGFFNILDCCKEYSIKKLIYASSSSVYGGNKKIPFAESDEVKNPVSLYAATKLSNELMAYTYSHLYNITSIGLRFFTVYGPWGRPDMAPMIFTDAILNNRPIKVFNNGNMSRDFTFIDDIIELIFRSIKKIEREEIPINLNDPTPAFVFNLGNSSPVNLLAFIKEIEKGLGLEAIKHYEIMQPGDVKDTYADNTKIQNWLNFKPNIEISSGVKKFIDWYKTYYKFD